VKKYIIMYGNPIDGFKFVGPFDSLNDALEHLEEEHADYDMCIAELQEPVK
jgi:hypothetical protein